MTTINISGIEIGSNCFSDTNVVSVDLNNVSFENNSMCVSIDVTNLVGHGVFVNCNSLTNITNINNNVTNMSASFLNCSSLINAPIIPNNVIDMSGTFAGCGLNNGPVIPNSVTNLAYTFFASGLVNAPDMSTANSVTDMASAFAVCTRLENVPVIPNSVTNLAGTFYACQKIKEAPVIPNSVTNMYDTFHWCSNITNDIYILSESIITANQCFYGTLSDKNVYIPFTYQNGVHTLTYNSFMTAGYSTTTRNQGAQLFDLNDYLLTNRTITVVFTNNSTGNDVGSGYYFNIKLKKDGSIVNTISPFHSGDSVVIGDADTAVVSVIKESLSDPEPITNTYSLTSLSNGDTLTIPCQISGDYDPFGDW